MRLNQWKDNFLEQSMNKTILVIDDDEILRETMARGLRASDFNVLTAESAEIAKQILTRISPDAIILDRMMTGQDGLSLLKDLRARGDIYPVIMLTALGGPENTIDGLIGGADDYMSKPFQLKELVLRLNNVMKKFADSYGKFPDGLMLVDGEFFIFDKSGKRLLTLSENEKSLLKKLLSPMGNVVAGEPMIAKRLRTKLNVVLSDIDIITIRGKGYKIIKAEK